MSFFPKPVSIPGQARDGAFSGSCSEIVDRLGRVHRRPLRKSRMPGRNTRLVAPPVVSREAEVEIGERAANGDVADGEWGTRELLGLPVQRQQRDSAALRIACQVDLRGMLALPLVPPQQQKIEKTVAERLPAQCSHPFGK